MRAPRGSRARPLIAALALVLALLALPVAAACSDGAVDLRGEWGSARFSVELADTPERRAEGLMHRTHMPLSAGMLFVYPAPQPVSFWMRNTLISLDMIFMDATGRVSRVHHEAVPHDETPIHGGDAVQYVLEINGGLAARLGIDAGSEMRHPRLDQDIAAWPCDRD